MALGLFVRSDRGWEAHMEVNETPRQRSYTRWHSNRPWKPSYRKAFGCLTVFFVCLLVWGTFLFALYELILMAAQASH